MSKELTTLVLCCVSLPLLAQQGKSFDASAAFGARPSVSQMRISPDGQSVIYLAPAEGQGSVAYTLSLAKGARPKTALSANGKPERLDWCAWVSNERLVCDVVALIMDPALGPLAYTRVVAVNADGSNPQLLSRRDSAYAHGRQLHGGEVIDWLPDESGVVLMTRNYLPDERIGSHLGSTAQGLGVDRVDTRNLATKRVEPPRSDAVIYISDGRGTVRIVGEQRGVGNRELGQRVSFQASGVIDFLYRKPGSSDWNKLSEYNVIDRSGFCPIAVDPDLNVAYGLKKKDGRTAVYAVTLEGGLREEQVYAHPDVDVDGLIRLGRQGRVVGVSYATEARHDVFFAPALKPLLTALATALPHHSLEFVDSSLDENRLLVFAGSDSDPGVYYIFDKKSHELQTFLVVRNQLEGVKLATMKSVRYPAADGVMVPGYLTLPAGAESAKGLPAVVLPHGGPSARDEWGFDWLSQFFASRGYAVLQPNFRGSSGYGDAWFEQNGFRSWEIAIGDVVAAGRWLVSQGIADPHKLGIVGWSYGGYAALQSAVVDPSVFRAVVAIAPVTDLAAFEEEHRHWGSYELVRQVVGEGAHVRDGSPAEHADRIKVPVLLFHGGFDRNVSIEQSRRMCDRLSSSGGKCELVTWDDLDHYLDDSAARMQMLRRSDEFLRGAFSR